MPLAGGIRQGLKLAIQITSTLSECFGVCVGRGVPPIDGRRTLFGGGFPTMLLRVTLSAR